MCKPDLNPNADFMDVDFMDLEKTYDRVNEEALCQVLRMYDVGDKLLNGINSLACVRVKGGENESFRIVSVVRQVGIMSTWLSIYIWKQS